MKLKTILPGFIFFFGASLIIIGLFYFGKELPAPILGLNIVVSFLIYYLFFSLLIQPPFSTADQSQKFAASLGVREYFYLVYAIAALTGMVKFNSQFVTDITSQFIAHGVLLFVLLLGIYFSKAAARRTENVYHEQEARRYALDELRKAVTGINSRLALMSDQPQDIVARLQAFQENLRYIAPSNAPDAAGLETDIAAEVNKLNDFLFMPRPDHAQVRQIIQNCESIFSRRKQLYSN